MPVQQQNSSFAQKLRGRVSAANAEHRDKPIDTGNRRLPSGIRNGVAKLSSMYTKEQTEDNGMVPKGCDFFRASAIVMSPESHNGERIAGMVTQIIVPLCDVPARGMRKATSFNENWYTFQNVFKLLGITPPNEDERSDPTGHKVEAYYFSAMQALTNPDRPVYITFSTRGWTPPPTQQQPRPAELVFETWHGLADTSAVEAVNERYTPGAGVRDLPPTGPKGGKPTTSTASPSSTSASNPGPPPPVASSAASPAVDEDVATPDTIPIGNGPIDLAEEIAMLVSLAMDDPQGETSDGDMAAKRLEALAWQKGWTVEQTLEAEDWAGVGKMALNPPTSDGRGVTVGSRWMFTRRARDGSRIRKSNGEEFPAREVEVVTSDARSKTCTVKTVEDGNVITDLRSKKPAVVEWGWLESITIRA